MDLLKMKKAVTDLRSAGGTMFVTPIGEVAELIELVERQEKELAGARFAAQQHLNTVQAMQAPASGAPDLPPLPETVYLGGDEAFNDVVRGYTYYQMTAYARAALAQAAPASPAITEAITRLERQHSTYDERIHAADGLRKLLAPASPASAPVAPHAVVPNFVMEAPDGHAENALSPDEFVLYQAMSDISEEQWFAGWLGGLEYTLWSALQGGELMGIDRDALAFVAAMSVKTGKWIIWRDDKTMPFDEQGPYAVPLIDWLAIYGAKNDMRAALAVKVEAQQAGVPDGWKLVPIMPTHEMVRAACDAMSASQSVRLAIAAAPLPPVVARKVLDEAEILEIVQPSLTEYGKYRFLNGDLMDLHPDDLRQIIKRTIERHLMGGE